MRGRSGSAGAGTASAAGGFVPRPRAVPSLRAVPSPRALLLGPCWPLLPPEAVAVSQFGFEAGLQLLSVLSVGLSHFY